MTGANKGIGLAIVKGLLEAEPSAFVFLGSRDVSRGHDAVSTLIKENAAFSGRVETLQIDVSDNDSVVHAAETVRTRFSDSCTPLTALVNNAGILFNEFSPSTFEQCINVNVHGVMRATEAFLPLLDPSKGRIVMVSSSAGPSYVAKCSKARQAAMITPTVTKAQITALIDECLSVASSGSDVSTKFTEAGLAEADNRSGYGFSKALVNMYTMHVAREYPALIVNACTPGFIVTDLANALAAKSPKTLQEMGAKPPSEGAKAPVFLTFGNISSSGWYFGSDCQRSPLDRYRSPGSPAYTGEN